MRRGYELTSGEILGQVDHARAESLCSVGVLGIVLEKIAVFLECGATTGRGDDDGVSAGSLEGVDILAGELASRVHHARVDVESATTLLTYGDVDVRAITGHDAGRRTVGVGEHGAHDAAIEKSHVFLLAVDRIGVPTFIAWLEGTTRNRRSQAFQVGHAHRFDDSDFSGQGSQASKL